MTKFLSTPTLTALGSAAVLGALAPAVTLVVAAHALLLVAGIHIVRAADPTACSGSYVSTGSTRS